MRIKLQPLKFKHFTDMFHAAHSHAFTAERNMAGWEREGILPKFNRNQLWKLRSELEVSAHRASSSYASCGATATASLLNAGEASSEGSPEEIGLSGTARLLIVHPGLEANMQPASTSKLSSMLPSSLQNDIAAACKAVPSFADMATRPKEEVLCTYLKLHELLKEVHKHAEASQDLGDGGEDDDDPDGEGRGRRGRVTAKDVWGRPGSATGAEALGILKAKHDDRKREAEEKAAREEERQKKHRMHVVLSVQKAATLIEKVAFEEPNVVKKFDIAELKALLTPQHSRKAQGQQGGTAQACLETPKHQAS